MDALMGTRRKKEANDKESFRSKVDARGSEFGVASNYVGVDTLFVMERNRKKRSLFASTVPPPNEFVEAVHTGISKRLKSSSKSPETIKGKLSSQP